MQVKGGIQDIKDKQEIAEAQLQIAKLQVSKTNRDQQLQTDSAKRSSFCQPSCQGQSLVACPQELSALSPNIPPNIPAHNPSLTPVATAPVLPTQYVQTGVPSIQQPESSHAPPLMVPETTQTYHIPLSLLQQQPPSPLNQPYQFTFQSLALYQSYQQRPQHPIPQSPQLPEIHPPLGSVNPQAYHVFSHQAEEIYLPPQGNLKSSSTAAKSASLKQFFESATQESHGQSLNRPYSHFPSDHSQLANSYNSHNLYSYGASPASYGGSTAKTLYLSQSSSVVGSGSNHSRLPTAKILPRALPMASIVDNGSGPGDSGKRVPVDDVVDKVVAMGFRRDLVRASMRKLRANGQSVDLNMVLDKLMNGGEV